MTVCRLSKFDNDRLLSFMSCLQITQNAIYFTYRPSHALDAAQRSHAHGAGIQDPLDMEVFPVDEDMENGFPDPWEDDSDSEDEDIMGMAVVADGQYLAHRSSLVIVLIPVWSLDPVHAILNNWLFPTTANTVYSVSF